MRVYEAKPAVIYAIKCGPFYKVGYAGDIWTRIQSMQSGNPLTLRVALIVETTAKVAPKAEFRAHAKLARFNHRDEWFRAPLHIIRTAIIEAVEETEAKLHPNVVWFPNGRPVVDLEPMWEAYSKPPAPG